MKEKILKPSVTVEQLAEKTHMQVTVQLPEELYEMMKDVTSAHMGKQVFVSTNIMRVNGKHVKYTMTVDGWFIATKDLDEINEFANMLQHIAVAFLELATATHQVKQINTRLDNMAIDLERVLLKDNLPAA